MRKAFLRISRVLTRVCVISASTLLVSNCAPNIQRVKPVVDQGLLIKCPDFTVWAADEDMAEYLLKTEKRYSDCQIRQNTLVDRTQDMMKH